MDRKTFIFYESYMTMGQKISDRAKRCEFYESIMNAALKGEELIDTGDSLIDMAYIGIRPLIEANIRNYENGRKGGAPKGNQNAKTTQKQPKNNRPTTQKQPYKDKDKDSDKDNNKDSYKDEDKDKDVDVYKDKDKDIKEEPAAPSHFETEEERKAREEREADEWWESLGDDRQ